MQRKIEDKQNKKTASPVLITIAGGSSSGKTTVAKMIAEKCDSSKVVFLKMDNYYRDFSSLSLLEKEKINFDNSLSVDFKLLYNHVTSLLAGKDIYEPVYDHQNYFRKKEKNKKQTNKVVILEGLFAFYFEEIKKLSSLNIFVETSSDLRVIRRIERDMELYKRPLKKIISNYINVVRPMHNTFIEKSKEFADIIIPFKNFNQIATDLIANKITNLISEEEKQKEEK